MLGNFENKSLAAPEAPAATDSATLRAQVAQLRSDEARQEKQLHDAQRELGDAEDGIKASMHAISAGSNSRDAFLSSAMVRQSAAQSTIATVLSELSVTRSQLSQATAALNESEARERRALRESLTTRYNTARKLLAERLLEAAGANDAVEAIELEAREAFPPLTPPGMPEAFYSNSPSWPSLSVANGGRIVSWLEDLRRESPEAFPEAANAIVVPILRKRALLEVKPDTERARIHEANRKRAEAESLRLGNPVLMKFDEDGKLVTEFLYK